jgi:hypothetical protein
MKHSKCRLNWCGKSVDFSVDLTPIKIPQQVDGRNEKDKGFTAEEGTNGSAKGGDKKDVDDIEGAS